MSKDGMPKSPQEAASRCGVYRASSAEPIAQAAQASGFDVARISFEHARGKDEILKRFAEAMEFPAWFGENWDALEDCLGDLSWREAPAHLLLLERHERLLPDDRGVLIDILASSAEYWAGRGRLFFTVFVDPGHALELPDLYRGS